MSRPAKVTSIDAVKRFRVAVKKFDFGVRDALTQLILEARRAVDWLEVDRTRYWPAQVRRASNEIAEAKVNLERCEMSISPSDRKSCYDEKKALDTAKQRLRTAEEKVKAVQRWKRKVKHEAEEFEVQVAKMNGLLDVEVPRTVATLERMIAALDRYTETQLPRESAAKGSVDESMEGVADDTIEQGVEETES